MSHELRTPLNAVIGFSDLLLEDREQLSATHVRYIEDVLLSGRHLLSLINSVLELARIDAGFVVLEFEPLDSGDELRGACALIAPAAERKSIRVVQKIAASAILRADHRQLQRVLFSLLSNAIKFSPAETEVSVSVSEVSGAVRFSVQDRGPGIPASMVGDLFQAFVQGESPLQKKHEGAGLGLVIARRLVDLHGGELHLEPTPGGGSTFWFQLPLSPSGDSCAASSRTRTGG
jgi:signal transduction histidine kinase